MTHHDSWWWQAGGRARSLTVLELGGEPATKPGLTVALQSMAETRAFDIPWLDMNGHPSCPMLHHRPRQLSVALAGAAGGLPGPCADALSPRPGQHMHTLPSSQ